MILLIIALLIILLPISAFASQIIGKHKKMTRSRIFTTISSIVAALILAFVTFIMFFDYDDGYDARDRRLIYLTIAIFALNLFYIWLQREQPNRNIWRKWTNIVVISGSLLFIGFRAFGIHDKQVNIFPDDGWHEAFDGTESQEVKDSYYPPKSFRDEFGFELPPYNVVNMKRWNNGYGQGGRIVTIKTQKPVTEKFLKQQVRQNVMNFDTISFSGGKFYGYKEGQTFSINLNPENIVEIFHDNQR